MKQLVAGVLIGGVFGWTAANMVHLKDASDWFERKEKCARYASQKAAGNDSTTDYVVSVYGFYSPSRDTCITQRSVTYRDGTIDRSVFDELTNELLLTYSSPSLTKRQGYTAEQRDQDARASLEFAERIAELKGE